MIDLVQKDGLVWKIKRGECNLCGREGVSLSIMFTETGSEIFITNLDDHKDAVNFIGSLKKAGILVQ